MDDRRKTPEEGKPNTGKEACMRIVPEQKESLGVEFGREWGFRGPDGGITKGICHRIREAESIFPPPTVARTAIPVHRS